MLERKALSDKILLLGVDGMDPMYTRKLVDEGKMPNVKKYIERGACREDLVLLGGHPTVTPPMWTTLATGCYANVHGITGFFRCGKDIDTIDYNLDSRFCKAEPLWNVFAEAGKKTLVWHWPGSSWPPTSDNPNLYVVDGTSPGSVGMATSQVDGEYIIGGSINYKGATYKPKAASEASAPCVITDLDVSEENTNAEKAAGIDPNNMKSGERKKFTYKMEQHTTNNTEAPMDMVQTQIKDATGWAAAPEGAKEFVALFSNGLVRRVGLITKNGKGEYDSISLYKKKSDTEPYAVLPLGKMVVEIIDEAIKGDKKFVVNRNMRLLELDPTGEKFSIYVSTAMDTQNDSVWHPKRLFKEITENVGYPTPTAMLGLQSKLLITDCMLANWYVSADWQSKAILHLIESEDLDCVFSHFHAIDLQTHMFIKHLADKPFNRLPHEDYVKFMEDVYVQTDYYLGKFIHLLDEGWTICIFSDHAQVAPKHDIPLLINMNGVCTAMMEEMGYTKTLKDEKGAVYAIDWANTKAVLQREGHIYINLKGKFDHGIVDPADQYELEEQIMTDLYKLTDPKTGHRIVSIALRNRDAILLGQGGPEAGDILCWLAEGYNYDHADCISTTLGEGHTSVSPIFIGSGKGFKQGFYTDRVIRQIDFVPTVAVIGGVRMPRECEGAPAYQILAEEY